MYRKNIFINSFRNIFMNFSLKTFQKCFRIIKKFSFEWTRNVTNMFLKHFTERIFQHISEIFLKCFYNVVLNDHEMLQECFWKISLKGLFETLQKPGRYIPKILTKKTRHISEIYLKYFKKYDLGKVYDTFRGVISKAFLSRT